MDINVVAQLVKEGRAHPFSASVLILLMIGTPYGYVNSARADDVKNIQAQLTGITAQQTAQRRENLEAQLTSVKGELFNLNQKVNDRKNAHQPVDQLYYDRIRDLEIIRDRLTRQLPASAP